MFKFITQEEDFSLMKAFPKQNFKLLVDPVVQDFLFSNKTEADKRVSATESLLF